MEQRTQTLDVLDTNTKSLTNFFLKILSEEESELQVPSGTTDSSLFSFQSQRSQENYFYYRNYSSKVREIHFVFKRAPTGYSCHSKGNTVLSSHIPTGYSDNIFRFYFNNKRDELTLLDFCKLDIVSMISCSCRCSLSKCKGDHNPI